jgi:hypothetical protein
MPYKSKAERVREQWVTLAEAVEHIRSTEICTETEAQQQLLAALVDDALHDVAREIPGGEHLRGIAWEDGVGLSEVLLDRIGEISIDPPYRAFAHDVPPAGPGWKSADIDWRTGTVLNQYSSHRLGERRTVLILRDALFRVFGSPAGVACHAPTFAQPAKYSLQRSRGAVVAIDDAVIVAAMLEAASILRSAGRSFSVRDYVLEHTNEIEGASDETKVRRLQRKFSEALKDLPD